MVKYTNVDSNKELLNKKLSSLILIELAVQHVALHVMYSPIELAVQHVALHVMYSPIELAVQHVALHVMYSL